MLVIQSTFVRSKILSRKWLLNNDISIPHYAAPTYQHTNSARNGIASQTKSSVRNETKWTKKPVTFLFTTTVIVRDASLERIRTAHWPTSKTRWILFLGVGSAVARRVLASGLAHFAAYSPLRLMVKYCWKSLHVTCKWRILISIVTV